MQGGACIWAYDGINGRDDGTNDRDIPSEVQHRDEEFGIQPVQVRISNAE